MQRVLGRVVVSVATVGVVLGLAVATVGPWVVARATANALEVVALTGVAVGSAGEGVAVAADVTASVADVVDGLVDAVGIASEGLVTAGPRVVEAADILGGEVADAVEAAVDAMPAVISSAEVIDGTLRILSRLGLASYDPDAPLQTALVGLEAALAPLPDDLRGQADLLRASAVDAAEVGEALVGVGDDLEELATTVRASAALLADYESTVEDTGEAVAALERDLRALRLPAAAFLVVLGIVLVLGQLVPVLVGLGLGGAGPLASLGGDQADHPERQPEGVEPHPSATEVESERLGE